MWAVVTAIAVYVDPPVQILDGDSETLLSCYGFAEGSNAHLQTGEFSHLGPFFLYFTMPTISVTHDDSL